MLVHTDDGVSYYRHILPMKYLAQMDWNITMNDFHWGEKIKAPKKAKTGSQVVEGQYGKEELDYVRRHSDILITQRNDIAEYNTVSNVTQPLFRIPWVYDTDDNIHATRPTNAGFFSYNPSSVHPVYSVIAQNQAFAVTVSTENLKEVYKNNNKRIYVLPNGVDVEMWDSFAKGKKPGGEIRISLMLSGAHFESIQIVEEVLVEIIKRYPQVRVYAMASFKGDLFKMLPKENQKQLVWVPWVAPKDWIKWNQEMNFDIGLAPLTDNDFNRAKSNLRILEYGIQGLATVASPVEPYKPACDLGLVLKATDEVEWFDALVELVEKPQLRSELGAKLSKYVRDNFDMKNLAKEYDRVYREIIKDFQSLYGQPLRDEQLTGTSHAAIAATIDSISARIVQDNTGKPPKFKPSILGRVAKPKQP